MHIDIPESGPVSLKMEEDLIKSYYATITYLDTLVGKLIKSLDDLGLSDNTTIVFWSDHGFFLVNMECGVNIIHFKKLYMFL